MKEGIPAAKLDALDAYEDSPLFSERERSALAFTEEITRLRSHETQFNRALKDGGEVSKKLTYILQEMHREASTIGAKATGTEIIQHVVVLKEETEKLREQVQNLE